MSYSHGDHSAAISHLISYVAHAAIWSAVSRLIRHAPVSVVVVVVLVSVVAIVFRRRPARLRRYPRNRR